MASLEFLHGLITLTLLSIVMGRTSRMLETTRYLDRVIDRRDDHLDRLWLLPHLGLGTLDAISGSLKVKLDESPVTTGQGCFRT